MYVIVLKTARGWKSLAERPNTGVFFVPDLTVYALRAEVIALVEKHHFSAIYSDPLFVKDGGLASYGPIETIFPRRCWLC